MSGTYPENWNNIALAIKTLAGWRCERCGHPHDPKGVLKCDDGCDFNYKHIPGKGRMLTVHHLDGNKSNCSPWNLAALCQACHLQIQVKVNMFQVYSGEHSLWFISHLMGFMLELEPEQMIHATQLIAQGKYETEVKQ